MSDLFTIVLCLIAAGLGWWLRGTSLNLPPEMRGLLESWIAQSKKAEAERKLRELMAGGQPATPPPQPAPQPAPVTPANPNPPATP